MHLTRDIDERPPACSTEWRCCPDKCVCLDNFNDTSDPKGCERIIAFPNSRVLDVRVMDEIDLAIPVSEYELIIEKGSLQLLKVYGRTDRSLITDYLKATASHIVSGKARRLGEMLTERGYDASDIDDLRRRIS